MKKSNIYIDILERYIHIYKLMFYIGWWKVYVIIVFILTTA